MKREMGVGSWEKGDMLWALISLSPPFSQIPTPNST